MLDCFSRMTPAWLHRAFVYTGSVGPFGNDFRFRCEQDEKNHLVHAAAYSKLCCESAQDVERRDFSLDDAGVEAMDQWLQGRYEAFLTQGCIGGAEA